MDLIDKSLLELREKLILFLSGNLALLDLISWVYQHPMYLKGEEHMTISNKPKAKLLDYAFSTILEAHPDEPNEYRESKEDIEEVLYFIDGKKLFEGEMIKIQ